RSDAKSKCQTPDSGENPSGGRLHDRSSFRRPDIRSRGATARQPVDRADPIASAINDRNRPASGPCRQTDHSVLHSWEVPEAFGTLHLSPAAVN
ncbi:MAG: hypothetical protein ACP5XB_27075, partial [Isosphaeraceae bacterium]